MAHALKRNTEEDWNLSTFEERYGVILEACATRVHAMHARGQRFTPTLEVAEWIVRSLPNTIKQTWGKGMKLWRVLTMLSNARFLGAFEALDIRAVRGKGLGIAKPRLRSVKGGKG